MSTPEKTFDEVLLRLVNTLGRKLSDEKKESLIQFLKFGIVGFSNTLLSYLINVAVLLLLRPYKLSWDYIAGNVIAFLVSVLWSFYWNNKYVFGGGFGQGWFGKLMKSYLSYGFTGIVLSNVFSYIWINVLNISKFIAPLLNLIISVPLNYIIHKYWVFKS